MGFLLVLLVPYAVLSIHSYSEKVQRSLIACRSTGKNITWQTYDYTERYGFEEEDELTLEVITATPPIICRSSEKTKIKRTDRAFFKAEVFTPLNLINKMNNLIDNEWFGYPVNFSSQEPILFKNPEKTWKDYVKFKKLEITCGEAPYVVHKYDPIHGSLIGISGRSGFLDRKLRVICENEKNHDPWLEWAEVAYTHSYGYELQGDNLFISRLNHLDTFVDFYEKMFDQRPCEEYIARFAYIISHNFWQMDGLNGKIPSSEEDALVYEWRLPDEEGNIQ